MIISEILVPLLNSNEPEARVVTIHARDGQSVGKGDLLFTIETTKTASEIESPNKGFFRLLVKEGDTLTVGEKLAVLTSTAAEPFLLSREEDANTLRKSGVPASESIRMTKLAQQLAKSLGLDLSVLPTNQLITESIVRQFATNEEQLPSDFSVQNQETIIIFGGGGHAKTIIEMVRQLGKHSIAGIVDDDRSRSGQKVVGVAILGTRALLPEIRNRGVAYAVNCVGGILDIDIRVKIFRLLEENGFGIPELVHPRATVEPSANLGDGVQVFANAYIGSDAVLETKSMVNTNSVVSHDCVIGKYTHIAPGALLAGHVEVGRNTLVGMGVTTAIKVKIGSYVRIGNGAIVLADVPDHTIIQAGRYWVGETK